MSILNWGQSALQSLANAMSEILTFIPRIIGCLVLLLIGWLVGMVVEKVLTVVLRKVGFDRLSDRIGLTRMTQRMGMRMDAAKLLGRVAFWFIFLIFLVPAAQALDVPAISNMLTLIYGYLPNVFAAIVVLLLGALIAHYAAEFVGRATSSTRVGTSALYANITRWAIIGFAAIVALEQLQIAPSIMNILFAAVIGCLALGLGGGLALALGLGGQDSARRLLTRGENQITGQAATQPTASQQMQTEQMRARQGQLDQARAEQIGTYQQQYEAPTEPPRRPPQR